MRLKPIQVAVTWDDAADRSASCTWDGTIEHARKIAEIAPLYKDRQTTGWLVYVDEEALWLAHDYDQGDMEMHNFTVIPLGWVTAVRAGRRKFYTR